MAYTTKKQERSKIKDLKKINKYFVGRYTDGTNKAIRLRNRKI